MSTEYAARFEGRQGVDLPDKNQISVGPKESSGYVDNKYYEDAISGFPGERWLSRYRQTGNTVYKDKFLPYTFASVR
jgi:hypothetical protein